MSWYKCCLGFQTRLCFLYIVLGESVVVVVVAHVSMARGEVGRKLQGNGQGFDFRFTFRINQNSHRAFAVGDGGVLVPLLVNVPPLTKDPLSLKYQHVDHR